MKNFNNVNGFANTNNTFGGNNMNNMNNNFNQGGFQPRRQMTNGPTPGQVKYYTDLCNGLGLPVDPNHMTWTTQAMSQEITRLSNQQRQSQPVNNQPFNNQGGYQNANSIGATPKQKQTIESISAELGLKPQPGYIEGLNMQQASEVIQQLIGLRGNQVGAKASTNQLNLLRDMYRCPNIPFEAFANLFSVPSEMLVEKQTLEGRMRFLLKHEHTTRERNDIADKIVAIKSAIYDTIENGNWEELGRQEVSDFIQQHQQAFYSWKDEQITPGQIYKIQQLQQTLVRFHNHWNVDLGNLKSDIAGNDITEVADVLQDFSHTDELIIDNEGLSLMTKTVAHEYINQLQKEVTRLSNPSYMPIEQRDFDMKEVAKSEREASENEQKALVDLIFRLYASLGQEAEVDTLNADNYKEKVRDLIELNRMYLSDNQVAVMIEESGLSPKFVQELLA